MGRPQPTRVSTHGPTTDTSCSSVSFSLPSPHRLTICLPLRELPTPSVLTSSPSKTTLTRHGFWIRGRCCRSSRPRPRGFGWRQTWPTAAAPACGPRTQRCQSGHPQRRAGRAGHRGRRFLDAITAAGGTRLTPGESVDALAEAIDIIRAVWEGRASPIQHDGEHYRVVGAQSGPAPAHAVEIWVGALKPRMLARTGTKADGWLPSLVNAGVDELPTMNGAIDAAAESAGRSPRDIRRMYNISGSFGRSPGLYRDSLGSGPSNWLRSPWSTGSRPTSCRSPRPISSSALRKR